jgi:hypothetical protein
LFALLGTLSCGEGDPAATAPIPAASIVGAYEGTYAYRVYRNALPDPEASLNCPMLLVITDAVWSTVTGRLEAMAPASGCGEPGARYSVMSGSTTHLDIGIEVELTVSPSLSSWVQCVDFQVNTLSGSFFSGTTPGREVELRRGFVCTDRRGDWLTINVTYSGTRRETR